MPDRLKNTSNTEIVDHNSMLDVLQWVRRIYTDIWDKFDGKDVEHIQELDSILANRAVLLDKTQDELNEFEQEVVEVVRAITVRLRQSLQLGFTVTSEEDYNVLQRKVSLLWKLMRYPDFRLHHSYHEFIEYWNMRFLHGTGSEHFVAKLTDDAMSLDIYPKQRIQTEKWQRNIIGFKYATTLSLETWEYTKNSEKEDSQDNEDDNNQSFHLELQELINTRLDEQERRILERIQKNVPSTPPTPSPALKPADRPEILCNVEIGKNYNRATWKKKEDIKLIQTILPKTVNPDLKIDGVWWPITTQAVAYFQYDNKNILKGKVLAIDGKIWWDTTDALNAIRIREDIPGHELRWQYPWKSRNPQPNMPCNIKT